MKLRNERQVAHKSPERRIRKPVFHENHNSFLDASSHLYKRVCPSVGPSVGPSIGHKRVEIMKNAYFEQNKAS